MRFTIVPGPGSTGRSRSSVIGLMDDQASDTLWSLDFFIIVSSYDHYSSYEA